MAASGIFDKNFGGILGSGGSCGCGGSSCNPWGNPMGCNKCDKNDPKKACFITAVRAGCFSGDFDIGDSWFF